MLDDGDGDGQGGSPGRRGALRTSLLTLPPLPAVHGGGGLCVQRRLSTPAWQALPLPLTLRMRLGWVPGRPALFTQSHSRNEVFFHLPRKSGQRTKFWVRRIWLPISVTPWSARLPKGISPPVGEVLGLVPETMRPTAWWGHVAQALIPTGVPGPELVSTGPWVPPHWLCNTPPPLFWSRPLGCYH